ncbi:adenylyltransferase/cytidyltransferase family protein [Marinisporobacter balticus]|uniref:RfaE bifunctional protein nucleotidyltransferase chain/domain n=1 Tax=Marinisporobacter balticus TaxID=2018667 RepID=A0A4R2L8M2_9FIRM|nr:adenylyltransferase/cytidyltransferase family protein [Marinisporobacter balticus]TCO79048.1 rfaE bifunctional protein nucleotidyltransferase chain/domain [Marinisporobacter balticus]
MKTHNPIILSLDQAQKTLKKLQKQGKKIVLTNGCYDLLHVGHIASLKFAKSKGDILVVAVNDDLSVRRLKGESRPIIPAKMRMELLSELKVVDYVILFSEDNALKVVKTIKPNVYVKGEEYNLRDTPEGMEVLKYSGKIESAPLVPSISTTAIIEKINKIRLYSEEMRK